MCDMTLNERASYIKGLCDGMEIDKTSKEGKVIAALCELVSNMAVAIEELEEEVCDLRDYIEEIDEDLADVEDFLDEEIDEDDLYDDDDEDEDDDDFYCDGVCEGCDGCDDEEFFEIVCPSCGETVCFDQELDPENLTCPACGEKFGCIIDEDELKTLE